MNNGKKVFYLISIATLMISTSMAQGIFDSQFDFPQLGDFKEEGDISVTGSGVDAIYTIQGNGNGLGDSGGQDGGFYVYDMRSGSWSMEGKVSWLDPEGFGPFGSVGMMIREEPEEPTSRHYSLMMTADGEGERTAARFRNLYAFPGLPTTEFTTENGEPVIDPGDGLWMRITHVESLQLFYSEYSFDGDNWELGHIQVFPWNAPELAYGLFIANDEDTEFYAYAEFTNLQFLSPPPIAERTLSQASFKEGDTVGVTINVFNSGDSPTDVTIQETIPTGWSASAISNGGIATNGTITWNLTDIPPGDTELTYEVTAPASPNMRAEWSGFVEGSLDIQGKSGLLLSAGGFDRISDDLVVLYTFDEGGGDTVRDVSEVGEPLDLTIRDLDLVEWGSGMLTVNGATKIKSGDPATKIIDSVMDANEITIEVWITPANIEQTGPARIATCSFNASLRNFTLGQSGTQYVGRLRTPDTGNNGSEPDLESPSGFATTVLTHVVYTRDDFWSTILYVNNEVIVNDDNILDIVGEFINGDIVGWDESYEFGLANEINAERPWLGDLHLVSIYNRALTEEEVAQNFAAGPNIAVDVKEWSIY